MFDSVYRAKAWYYDDFDDVKINVVDDLLLSYRMGERVTNRTKVINANGFC